MNLTRDYEYEARTGVCSCCGRQLELDPDETFYSYCLACDASDEWEDDYPEFEDDPIPDIGMDGELIYPPADYIRF